MPLITRNSQNANVKLGTTAQLAAITFTDGDLASDTTLNKVKVFNGVSLTEIGSTSFSSSAVVSQSTTIANYSTPTAAVASSPTNANVEYLVIAGGGGGGASNGGGGGSGGLKTASGFTVSVQTYTITVGAGGLGTSSAANGGDSVFSTITATGGGRGGSEGVNSSIGVNGGSGGGGGGANNSSAGGTGSDGFNGGIGFRSGGTLMGGGGGGSSSIGIAGSGAGGTGGNSTLSSISGSSVAYAGGGGGGGMVATAGSGGGGGAGNGNVSDGTGGAGTANTGSGGGGGGNSANGGAGGSGIVIIKYETSSLTATGGTVTTSGIYSIHTFNSSSSFIITAILSGAALAIDNNTATRWTSNSESNPNIYVDMGSALNLCAAAFYFDSTDTTNTEILIQSSPDASVWTTRRTITESNLTNGAYNYYRFNIAGGARYIRFYGNSAGSTVLSIFEIKILKKTDAEIFNDLGILTITASDTALGPDGT